MRKTLLSFVLFIVSLPLFSQSQSKTHVVQKGETLYAVSRKYKVSVEDICLWNNRSRADVLEVGTQLWVAAPGSVAAPKPVEYQAVDKAKEAAVEGSTAAKPSDSKPFQFYVKQGGGQHIVQYGESIDNLARLYGYTSERFREFNGLAAKAVATPGMVLRSTDCDGQIAAAKPVEKPVESASQPAPQPNNTQQKPISKPAASTQPSGTTMTDDEIVMVNEINLMRSNPSGYIPFIEEYIEYMKTNGEFGNSIETARELIGVLKNTAPLSQLAPTECVYQAAKKHGQDQLKAGSTNHQGTDGSWPWDRILRECSGFQDGNENLVGGPSDIRRAVILLLVDDGISNRGHRETLLNPHWKYVACYKIGQVGDMPNCWIQNFAM